MTRDVPTAITIDIWSDVMCPWCAIGYGQLSKALDELAGEIEAEIRWRPFELNPDMPAEGEEQGAHLARKYRRSEEETQAVRAQMKAIAEQAGVTLEFTGEGDAPPAMMRNTFAAHTLLDWALETGGPDAQTRLKLALFEAHFNHRRDVSDHGVLVEIARATGLDAEDARDAIGDERRGEKVRAEERRAWDMNISGVPAMVVNGKFMIPGAQSPETYVTALRRVAARG